jgi:hypothetical protein
MQAHCCQYPHPTYLTCPHLFTEGKIQEIQQSMDARLNNMPPSQRQQYYDLVAEQGALMQVGV